MAVTQKERTALALAALGEVTDPADVGELLGVEEPEPGVLDLRFACTLSAYAGWSWIVSTSDLPDHEPTVLEVELLPGDGALLAPPWVPWTDRLAEWRRQHPDEQHPDEDAADDEAGVDDDVHDDDDGDLDEDDLAVDDDLDELDDAELAEDQSPAEDEAEDDDDDLDDDDGLDEDDLSDDDEREVRPADEDRGP